MSPATALQPKKLRIQVTHGDGRIERLALLEGETAWFGRSSDCAIVLASNAVSRRHLSLMVSGGELVVSDASHNGTVVDGTLLKRASRILRSSSTEVQVGPFCLNLLRHGASAGPAPVDPPSLRASDPGVKRVKPTLAAKPELPPPDRSPTPSARRRALTEPKSPVGHEEPLLRCEASAELRRKIHRKLLDYLELPKVDRAQLDAEQMRPKVWAGLTRIVGELAGELPSGIDTKSLVSELCDEALGLGPLESLLADPDVSEIMVVDPHSIYAERCGRIEYTGLRFTDDESVRSAIERIVTPLGRRIDESTPLVDARLKDGSRVNAVIPPLAIKGACITIRKFAKDPLLMDDLIRFGSLSERMARFLERAVRVRRNIVISGGTGSGKTTLLNVLSSAIPEAERLVTIEDAAELQLRQPHVVSLESRPPNLEGKGEYTIRDLLKNALRMRPDRIIVGECRGGETLDMLQAMNTGHEGSMTTTHANSPREAVARIETLCLMAGLELPVRAIRTQIASSVHLVLQQTRFSDGSRRVISVAEVVGIDENGDLELAEIFKFERTGTGPNGKILGEYRATGYLPSFIDLFISHGLVEDDRFL